MSTEIPYFSNAYRTNSGHVSRQQFKQTLSMLNYHFTAEELDAMAVKYGDGIGFDYLKLMKDIEPQSEDDGWVKFLQAASYMLNTSFVL